MTNPAPDQAISTVATRHRVTAAQRAARLWRLTPAIALATVIALLTAGGFMAHYVDLATERQEVDEASVQARVLAATVTAALSFSDRQAAQEYVNASRANPQIEAAAIYDAGGKLFVGYRQTAKAALPTDVQPDQPRFASDRRLSAQLHRAVRAAAGALHRDRPADDDGLGRRRRAGRHPHDATPRQRGIGPPRGTTHSGQPGARGADRAA
jgi:hypothetical protein